jgi:hypothetical protein
MNLVPDTPSPTPNYWCTWGIQTFSSPDLAVASWQHPVNQMQEHILLGDTGWFTKYIPAIRSDLYLLFDVGWDLPLNMNADADKWLYGSLEVSEERFPSCTGSPSERLRTLNRMTKDAGWKGAGIWVSPQMVGEQPDGEQPDQHTSEQYWTERVLWSRSAGIMYWKVDVGRHNGSAEYRRMLTQIARREFPELVIEHAIMAGPLNDVPTPWGVPEASTGTGRFTPEQGAYRRGVEFLMFSHVLRTYDVTAHLSVATTLERVARLLHAADSEPQSNDQFERLINCEDEPYLGAALGLAMGFMRHPCWNENFSDKYDPTHYSKRIDEITRAVRWQRIAPAFGVGAVPLHIPVNVDEQLLRDSWTFEPGETWASWVIGQEVVQTAPARVTRGIPLPEVRTTHGGIPPFVVASRHPNGAVAVATLPRTSPANGIRVPHADITLDLRDGASFVGIFGEYSSLTLKLPLGKWDVHGHDLAFDSAHDLTEQVHHSDEGITIPGELIRLIGLEAATDGDLSEPGMVLKLSEL